MNIYGIFTIQIFLQSSVYLRLSMIKFLTVLKHTGKRKIGSVLALLRLLHLHIVRGRHRNIILLCDTVTRCMSKIHGSISLHLR